jgi:hypothetical protein
MRFLLRWIYTSEGLGGVVEWINDDDDDQAHDLAADKGGFGLGLLSVAFNGGIRDTRGRKGTPKERKEKLGQVRCHFSSVLSQLRLNLEWRIRTSAICGGASSTPTSRSPFI